MSCNSCSNVTLPGVVGPAGAAGADGLNGNDGNDGVFGGYSVQWQFETDILAPPSPGYLKLNNATPASVTELFVHDTAKNSIDASSFLASFTANNNPGSYGLIRIFKRNSSTVFWSGKVTGVVNSGSYYTLSVTPILSNGTFSADDDLVVSFVSNGVSSEGVPVLFMDTTGHNTASNNATSAGTNPIRTDQIDGGTIETVGDFIKIKGEVIADTADNYVATVRIKFGGADMFSWYAGTSMGGNALKFEVDLVVSDTDEIRPHVYCSNHDGFRTSQVFFPASSVNHYGGVSATSTSAITLDSNQNIEVEISSDGVNTATLTYYEVTKYLKS
jgi:hypothetical protein